MSQNYGAFSGRSEITIEDLMEQALRAMPMSGREGESYSFVYASNIPSHSEDTGQKDPLPSTTLDYQANDDQSFGLRAPLMLMGIPTMSSPDARRRLEQNAALLIG